MDYFIDNEASPSAPNSLDKEALEQELNDLHTQTYFKGRNLKMA